MQWALLLFLGAGEMLVYGQPFETAAACWEAAPRIIYDIRDEAPVDKVLCIEVDALELLLDSDEGERT